MSDAPCLRAALSYAERGWAVFPVHAPTPEGRCTCQGRSKHCKPGKHPRPRNGLNAATTDPERIRRWWRQWPDANVGIRTGSRSGVVVLDVDERHGGQESLAGMQARHGALPKTPTARTGNGQHWYFRCPADAPLRNSAGRIAQGLDLRAENGCVVAPPSIHATGCVYCWEVSPDEQPLADLPLWCMHDDTEQTEQTEQTEIQTQTEASGGLLTLEAVVDAIEATLPTASGQRNRRVFDLARGLKGIEQLASRPVAELRPIVRDWHRRATPYITTKPFDDTWADFVVAWPRVKFAGLGNPLKAALAEADARPFPQCADNYDCNTTRRLVRWCMVLQERAGENPFFLSGRSASKYLRTDHRTVARRLLMLCTDGVLSVAEAGGPATGKATRYRYESYLSK